MSDKILDSLCQLKIKDNQRLPRRFFRRPFLPRLQKVCLTFVFLSALSSAMKWRRGRRKSGKTREDDLPAKFLSALLAAARLHSNGEFIVFDDATDSTMLHFWPKHDYDIFHINFDCDYMTRFFSRQKLIDFSQVLYSIPKSFRSFSVQKF